MITTRSDQSGNTGVLTLTGELTLKHADEMRTALTKATVTAAQVTLNIEKAGKADRSCRQLLCSAHRTCMRLNKRMAFSGALPDILNRVAVEAGFARCVGCDLDRQKSCLWAGSCS